ncbi:MAG: hypothetical protein ACK5JE_09725 [Castellaniella sp.]|uniref:hypothetical protein n=1 Tax=Castellaniella sp. TaxID=1955812 RepID=UPI003A85F258
MRRNKHATRHTALLAISLGCAALFAPGVQAEGAQTQYQKDVARCHNTPGIDVQACLKEAGAASQASSQGALAQPSAQARESNRTERCEKLPAGQRQDCLSLMDQPATRTTGSVQSGGMLRETTIPIPAPAGGS